MLCLLAKTMCGRTQLMMPRADPEEGAGVRTPAPWKITYSIGLYRNMQLDPSPCEKLDPLEMLDRPSPWILESYGLMIVFFEKAMITRLPLQNKLRTYNKNEEKKTSELFFSQSGLDPPPPNPTKISWIREWIYVIVVVEKRYRS